MPTKAKKKVAATEEPSKKKNSLTAMRLPDEYREEWDRWQALSAEEGIKEFRDWLFPKVRQALAPRPRALLNSTEAAEKRGRRIGIMIGKLDIWFALDREEEIDLVWLTQWVERYPDCVDEVCLAMLSKPYGLRFDQWWHDVMADSSA